MPSIDRQAIVIGVTATAAVVGCGIFGYVKWRRYKNRFAHFVLKHKRAGVKSEIGALYEVPGTDYWQPGFYFDKKEHIDNLDVFKDDVWVVTFPKAGTTWTQEVVWLICHEADTEAARATHMDKRFPFLDAPGDNIKKFTKVPRPRFIKSHLPLGLLPKRFHQVKPKVIYTARNPKDTFVSFYHFSCAFSFVDKKELSFSVFLDEQLKLAGHGGFWDHILEAWQQRDKPNLLFLKFEDMIQDLPKEIRKIAAFLGKTLTEEQVDRITEHCSFKSMKDNPQTNMLNRGGVRKGSKFMRKGKVGDWRSLFTPVQSEKVDQLTAEWLETQGLTFGYN